MSESEVQVGNYISLRSRWIFAHIGYHLDNRTAVEWDRFDRSAAGRQHKENTAALRAEFDSKVWPKILELIPETSEIGPFTHPGEYMPTEADKRADERQRRKDQRAIGRAFGPRR